MPARRVRAAALLLASGLLAAGCNTDPSGSLASSDRPGAAGGRARAASPAPRAVRPVAPLRRRVRPDVLVVSAKPLTPGAVKALRGLGKGGFTTFRSGRVKVGGAMTGLAGVDPSSFRSFAPEGTAEADAVWASVAAGELAVSHDTAKARRIGLGTTLPVHGRSSVPLRVGVLATANLPGVAGVVADDVAASLGLPAPNAAVLSSGKGDPAALAKAVRKVVPGATTHLLTQPPTPFAFLKGGSAAAALGGFTYRYYEDGTIEPDARWVSQNIVRTQVPILGWVTCHRRMVPQLRSALAEIQAAGLASKITTYDGCYVPRFIERDPSHAISLHTWGIAIDLDAATNGRGVQGTMDPQVVSIFKRWGFRWGGDWTYTDPMHFELAAIIS
jgi:hypothetical protein